MGGMFNAKACQGSQASGEDLELKQQDFAASSHNVAAYLFFWEVPHGPPSVEVCSRQSCRRTMRDRLGTWPVVDDRGLGFGRVGCLELIRDRLEPPKGDLYGTDLQGLFYDPSRSCPEPKLGSLGT